jgi:hypothetical protein
MRRLSFHAMIIGGLVLLTVLLTYPMILHLTSHIPHHQYLEPSERDHWPFLWALGFVTRSVVEEHRWPFSTDMLFYPHGVDLTHPLLLGMGLPLAVSIPFVQVFGVVATYNLFILGAFTATAYVTFLLVRYLTHDSRAAFASGVIFAFSPYHMARAVTHFNLATSGMWIPLYILLFMRAVQGGRAIDLVFPPLVLALTFAANPYYAVFLGFFTAIYVVYHIISDRESSLYRAFLRHLCYMGGLALFLFLPVAWLLLVPGEKESQLYIPLAESSRWGADLLAFFVPSLHHTLWGSFVRPIYTRFYALFDGNDTEQTVYIGYIVLALAVVAVIKAPKAKTRFWLVAAVIFFGLSLGPFLHIYGRDTLSLNGLELFLPLPSFLLHVVPGLSAVRVSSRFSVMLMLAMAVLAGYGIQQLLQRVRRKAGAALLCLCLIVAAIACEFLIAPLPLLDARIPKIYERIAQEGEKGRTLLDVPLYWNRMQYQYFQITHRQRLFLGVVPRLSLSFLMHYADAVPFMPLFKKPELIGDYDQSLVDRRDVLSFIEFFDLSWIVIHKQYIAPEIFERLMLFLRRHFPITQEIEGDNIVALQVTREASNTDTLVEPDGYVYDFDPTNHQVFLTEGYSAPERWDDLTVVWSEGKASALWVYFPRVEDFTMELRLQPFNFPGSPPQGLTIVINGQPAGEITLATQAWHSYTMRLPATILRPGINTLRFRYRYAVSPASVIPGAQDPRKLAVAFDFVRFRPERP